MQQFFDEIDDINDVGQVIHRTCGLISEQGVIRQSYYNFGPFASATSEKTSVISKGFPKEWTKLYDDWQFRAKNPIPKRVLEHGTMLTWLDAIKTKENSAEEREYLDAMQRYGLVHGFGVPLFGVFACDAYASFDFGKPVEEVSQPEVGLVRALAQVGHQRACILIKQSEDSYELSERETEVLEWLALGKSIWAVACILDLSPDTVKTYCKRIYAKLDVSDRVGAVVTALKLGLIKLH